MQILRTRLELDQYLAGISHRSLGFVPTMGALHLGHISLILESKKRCQVTGVSIFVNPTQFGANEDFSKYPRPEADDLKRCEQAQVDFVWLPSEADIYPTPESKKYFPHQSPLFDVLCGAFRPGHFAGVVQVVNLLLEAVVPSHLFLGEKDYQQFVILKNFVAEKALPVLVLGCPTLREPDGLALSSRNQYLQPPQREVAASLYLALICGRNKFKRGETNPVEIMEEITENLDSQFIVQYLKLVDAETLQEVNIAHPGNRLIAAAFLGGTRLIDNISL